MPSTFVAFSNTSAFISVARSAAQVSVVKNGLPVPAARMMQRPFSRVAQGAAADEGLADALDVDRRHHARRLAETFHRFLQRQRVDDGREHAHVVGGGALDVAVLGKGRAADEIAAPDDHRELDAQL
jgi:hypothetical protein